MLNIHSKYPAATIIAASFVVLCHFICVLVSFYLITNGREVQSMITTSKIGRLKKERTQAHSLLTRGQVAAFEQVKILREALANGTEEHAPPQNRGQVAAQEQTRVLREAVAGAMIQEHAPPQNRGQVAAQEQFKIMREALGMLNA
jgi:hypothetical protein